MLKQLIALALLAVPAYGYTRSEVLDAIRQVETGGQKNGGRDAVGDGGRAIGPYQIHYSYWKDSGVPGRYEQCKDPAYARRVVDAYLERYTKSSATAEEMARVHNGGPAGMKKEATVKYWKKVKNVLDGK